MIWPPASPTFYGLSIACAVSEHLANVQVLVEEPSDDLLFLHQMNPDGASRSYGIQAAQLARVTSAVVQRANRCYLSYRFRPNAIAPPGP